MICKIASGILEDVFRIALVTGLSAHFRSFPRLIVDITAYCLYRQTEAVGRYVPRR